MTEGSSEKDSEKKTKEEKLRGGKNIYVNWLSEIEKRDVLFVFKNRGYGLGWLKNKINGAPSTRVGVLRDRGDFLVLLKSFLLEEGVLSLAFLDGLDKSPWFQEELKKHSKNILYKYFEKLSLNLLPPIDSSFVEKQYSNGVFRGDYIKPKQVFFTEIRTSSASLADSLLSDFNIFGDFEKLSKKYRIDKVSIFSLQTLTY